MTTVHTLVAVLSIHQWHISQMNVKNAFLNGDDLQEEVYTIPLPSVPHNPREVCRLKWPLYSLRQATCAWLAKFSNELTSLCFHPNHHDPALFLKCNSAGHILLSIYVYDMIIIGDDVDEIVMLKFDLASLFLNKGFGSSMILFGY